MPRGPRMCVKAPATPSPFVGVASTRVIVSPTAIPELRAGPGCVATTRSPSGDGISVAPIPEYRADVSCRSSR